jgi:hypothetical protein
LPRRGKSSGLTARLPLLLSLVLVPVMFYAGYLATNRGATAFTVAALLGVALVLAVAKLAGAIGPYAATRTSDDASPKGLSDAGRGLIASTNDVAFRYA